MKKITALLLAAILLLNFTQMLCFAEEEPPETGVLIEDKLFWHRDNRHYVHRF